jgi:glucuronoarabinoxylan endo-1,4-beta-xylanase
MYDNGAPIYAISISNEPNYTAGYDGCEWKPEQMRKFFEEVGHFTDGVRGFGGGKQRPVVLTVNGESANTPFINVAAMTSPQSRAAIDLLCRHVYGEQTVTLWRYTAAGTPMPSTSNEATFNPPNNSATVNILDRPDGTKYEVWMTEHNINSANATAYPSDSTWPYVWRFMNDVDLVMRINNENAFVWWASKRFYSMIGDGSYNTNDGAKLPRGYGLSHYAKYTNDTHRIVTTISGTLANGATPISEGGTSGNSGNPLSVVNVNDRTFSLDNESARITAYASITSGKDNAPIDEAADDVEFISLVMWTPTRTNGQGGVDMGIIEIKMPDNFTIGSYTAIKSTSGAASDVHQPYTVTVASDRKSAFVTLNGSQMLSVKFIKE